jgi:hypothetical protein
MGIVVGLSVVVIQGVLVGITVTGFGVVVAGGAMVATGGRAGI